MSDKPGFRELTFYANIGKRKLRWNPREHEPILKSTTSDDPSKANGVIAAVKISIQVPIAMLDRDGPPVFVSEAELDPSALRQVRVIGVDLLPSEVPPVDTVIPLQEPVEGS